MATSNNDHSIDTDIVSAKAAYALAASLVIGLTMWAGALALIV